MTEPCNPNHDHASVTEVVKCVMFDRYLYYMDETESPTSAMTLCDLYDRLFGADLISDARRHEMQTTAQVKETDR